MAIEPEPFLEIYPEIMLPDRPEADLVSRWTRRIIGRKLAQTMGLEDRRHFRAGKLHSSLRVGKPFDFVIDGIYDTDQVEVSAAPT